MDEKVEKLVKLKESRMGGKLELKAEKMDFVLSRPVETMRYSVEMRFSRIMVVQTGDRKVDSTDNRKVG